jgi:prepilin-type processing-associated H-X9-DG protein
MSIVQSGGERYRSWADVLNVDIMGQLDKASGAGFYNNAHTLYGNWELQTKANYNAFMNQRRFLRCPNYIPAGDFTRFYAINLDANGGQRINVNANPITAPAAPARYPGDYGKEDPGSMHEGANAGLIAFYFFGADIRRFNARQFWIVETERASDTSVFGPGSNANSGAVTVGQNTASPYHNTPWSAGSSSQFTFRHPYFKKANFLYFDGHVDQLTPNDDVNSRRRLSIDQ